MQCMFEFHAERPLWKQKLFRLCRKELFHKSVSTWCNSFVNFLQRYVRLMNQFHANFRWNLWASARFIGFIIYGIVHFALRIRNAMDSKKKQNNMIVRSLRRLQSLANILPCDSSRRLDRADQLNCRIQRSWKHLATQKRSNHSAISSQGYYCQNERTPLELVRLVAKKRNYWTWLLLVRRVRCPRSCWMKQCFS